MARTEPVSIDGERVGDPPASPAISRALVGAGVAAVVLTAALLGVLHVLPPTAAISPVRRTISEYALRENGWVFNLAVLLLAAGSIAVLLALIRTRLVARSSAGAGALLLWSVSLALLVIFPKHNWAVGPSANGDIHRLAGVVAFISLPIAALLIGRRWLADARWRGAALVTIGSGVLSLLCFAPIALAYLAAPLLDVPWWRAIPLGAVERLLGLSELLIVLVLAGWAGRATGVAAGRGPANGGPANGGAASGGGTTSGKLSPTAALKTTTSPKLRLDDRP